MFENFDLKTFIENKETRDLLWNIGKALLVLIIGFPLIKLMVRLIRASLARRVPLQTSVLVSRLVKYVLFILLTFTILKQFGIQLGPLLGAAGVMGVAVGFASQTSLSNIISGVFLIGEKPFQIGDTIEADGVTGVVENIGLISLTLRTFDNKMVRIPNETLVKSKVTNITKNPIRRYNFDIGVSYNEDIKHVINVLRDVTEQHPLCLNQPAPLVLFKGFGASSLDFMVGAWVVQKDYLNMRNDLMRIVKERFDAENIEIAFPHVTIAGGKAMSEIPIGITKE